MVALTKTERKIYDVLLDGLPRTRDEILQQALGRRVSARNLIPMHVLRMRPKLKGLKMSIMHEEGFYRLRTDPRA